METETERPLRADAARNAERIVRAARAVFADLGPDAPLEEIARRADVRIRTLYNHFPSKSDLVRAAVDQAITEDLAPATERALADEDPLRGLISLIEAAMGLVAQELNTVAAARNTGTLTAAAYTPFLESLALLARRAQDAGLLRADLVPDDLARIMAMLTNTLWTMDPGTDGWRRYLALLFEGLAPAASNPLPAPAPLRRGASTASWAG
ncbi:TetR family transcriptional regulator [Actinoplanes sp. ATCC 53533]|uniref:TetR/AcrR family transcriptional regulator n=1 Tax=Actinoplanes sp. ATCC 53533 TaxID=1288362 RepID=UPI000F7A5B37|nr:TetR/AcrR family transcriptional regulator [Actinoplanes sp. ATCC 53533]RSM46791.1 TetR family transcriptional regulator [Actinoplanes sp. ATCC 53533]